MNKERESMELPAGWTCWHCFAFDRFCHPMGIAKEDQTRCDYYPVRFKPDPRKSQPITNQPPEASNA